MTVKIALLTALSGLAIAGCPAQPVPSQQTVATKPDILDLYHPAGKHQPPTEQQFRQFVGCYKLGLPRQHSPVTALPSGSTTVHLMRTDLGNGNYLAQFSWPAPNEPLASWHMVDDHADFAWTNGTNGYEFRLSLTPNGPALAERPSGNNTHGTWQSFAISRTACQS